MKWGWNHFFKWALNELRLSWNRIIWMNAVGWAPGGRQASLGRCLGIHLGFRHCKPFEDTTLSLFFLTQIIIKLTVTYAGLRLIKRRNSRWKRPESLWGPCKSCPRTQTVRCVPHLSIFSAGTGPPGGGRVVTWGALAWGTPRSSPRSVSAETMCSHPPWPGLEEIRRMGRMDYIVNSTFTNFTLRCEAEMSLILRTLLMSASHTWKCKCWGHTGAINKVLMSREITINWRKHASTETKQQNQLARCKYVCLPLDLR